MNTNRFRIRILAAALFAALLSTAGPSLQAQDLDVPYVPTPQNVVDAMLELAQVSPGDYVIDLGSGDGRIVITAARRGAIGHGIDLDPERIREARENAERQGVDDRVMFLQEDLFETDFSDANVITMYLLTSVNRELRPMLLENLEPGTRLVSHSFDMGDWTADERVAVSSGTGSGEHTIYYWVVPARVNGDWTFTIDGESHEARIDQQYQNITVSVGSFEVEEATLNGERISLILSDGGTRYILSGRADEGEITGTAQIHEGEEKRLAEWTAGRN